MPLYPPAELAEVVVEVVEVDVVVVEAGADVVVDVVVVVAEVEHSDVLGSMDLEFFSLLKKDFDFVGEILFLYYFHPFGI